MNKKYLLVGFILVILIVAGWLFFNLGITCRDGQGSTIYLPKNTLLKNLESANESEIRNYYIPPTISVGYIAKTATNPCGKIKTRIIIENGKEKSVSQSNFDKFISDYNANCGSCLFQLSQSGNSPLFIKEYSSGQSYMIENNNGALILKPIETTSTQSLGTDKTADWKTYRNEQYGFEVKYPLDYRVNPYGLSPGGAAVAFVQTGPEGTDLPSFSIWVITSALSPEAWLKSTVASSIVGDLTYHRISTYTIGQRTIVDATPTELGTHARVFSEGSRIVMFADVSGVVDPVPSAIQSFTFTK